MMKKFGVALSLVALAGAALVAGQQKMAEPPKKAMSMAANPITDSTKMYYGMVKDWITKSAEQMPETDYSFKPATMPAADKKDIRTFGQVIGHLADANYMFCGVASGVNAPFAMGTFEKKMTKADLQKGLADSFAFCDKTWAATTDKNAAAAATFPPGVPIPATTRIGALSINTAHEAEHYGNLVTYMRAKGMVPPSSMGMGGGI